MMWALGPYDDTTSTVGPLLNGTWSWSGTFTNTNVPLSTYRKFFPDEPVLSTRAWARLQLARFQGGPPIEPIIRPRWRDSWRDSFHVRVTPARHGPTGFARLGGKRPLRGLG